MTMSKKEAVEHFYLLDITRWIAAFAIIVWHFQHFYFVLGGRHVSWFYRAEQPFYGLLWPFYEYGNMVVPFFFCLSGFIFFWKYSQPVGQGKVSASEFFLLRLSRLYPLHLLTLLIVALLEWICLKTQGAFYVYFCNDIKHFFLHLFLISHWGFQSGWSFNSPSWAVSSEFFAYIVFFILGRLKLLKMFGAFGVIAAAICIPVLYSGFAEVLLYFFSGGLMYLFYQKIILLRHRYWETFLVRPLLVFFILLGIAPILWFRAETYIFVVWLSLFGPLILLLALIQNRGAQRGKSWAWLGNMTYSSYMIHFPLTLLIFLGFKFSNIALIPDMNLFLGFHAILWPLSWLCYKFVENPMQDWLRRKFTARLPKAIAN